MTVSLDQFGRSLCASRLFTADEVKNIWATLPTDARPKTAGEFAARLVALGKLTGFQARELLAGHTHLLVLGDYTIVDRIGAGGMGQVFKALHRRLEKLVALKVLAERVMQNPEAVKRFQREVRAAGKVVHPNIVVAHDAGESHGVHYLVMEYVEGQDLGDLVRAHGPLPVNQAVSCVLQAARGLEHAHKRGLVHRDIKPANLLLDHEGTVKILDLGLALIEDPLGTGAEEQLTGTGNIMGTIDFMSPEQALDTTHVDARTDIYSLGCTLYFLLTGRKLYEADTVMKRLLAHREAPIPTLSTTRIEVSPTIDAVYQRMVAKRADERYADMGEVARALQAAAPTAQKSLGDTSGFQAESGSESSGLKEFLRGVSVKSTPVVAAPSTRDDTASKRSSDLVTDGMQRRSPVSTTTNAAALEPTALFSPAKRARRKLMLGGIGTLALLASALVWMTTRNDVADGIGNENQVANPSVVANDARRPNAIGSQSPLNTPLPVNLLALVTPADTPTGNWEFFGEALRLTSKSATESSTRSIPFDAPYEYDLRAVVERVAGAKGVILGLGAGASRFHVIIEEGREVRTEFAWIDGKAERIAPQKTLCVTGRKQLLEVQVRRSGVTINWDGSKLYDYDGPLDRLTRVKGSPSSPFFISATSDYVFHELTLLPVTTSSVENSLSLLKQIAPFSDKNGSWQLDRGSLHGQLTGAWQSSLLPLRVTLPREYDLHSVVERMEGSGDVQFGLTSGAAKFLVFLNSANPKGPVIIGPNSTIPFVKLSSTPTLANTERRHIIIRVRTDLVEVAIDGQVAARYTGPVDELSPTVNEAAMSGPFLRIYSRTRFHTLEVRPHSNDSSNSGTVARKSPQPANAPFDSLEAKKFQAAWATYLGVEPISQNSQEMKFALIPPGTFLMGNTQEEIEKVGLAAQQEGEPATSGFGSRLKFEAPQHSVTLTTPFRLQTTEVTIGQFRRFIDATKFVTAAEKGEGQAKAETEAASSWRDPKFSINTEESPVSHVTWSEAVRFCNWLSEVEHLEPAYRSPDGKRWERVPGSLGYRLPTEAEWEHACRAGTTTRYYFGDDASLLGEHAWFNPNSSGGPRPVGQKKPNPYGLYDLYGNLNEWCWDQVADEPYEAGNQVDPVAEKGGNRRALRGSPFGYRASFCRSAKRFASWETHAYNSQGFRIAQTLKEVPPGIASIASAAATMPSVKTPQAVPSPTAPVASSPPPLKAPFTADEAKRHQTAWADYLGLKAAAANSLEAVMVLIPPGEFLMGTSDEEIAAALTQADAIALAPLAQEYGQFRFEAPQHLVRLSRPFRMADTETTVAQFQQFVAATGHVTEAEADGQPNQGFVNAESKQFNVAEGDFSWRSPGWKQRPSEPVVLVAWSDAIAYCNWLSRNEGFEVAYSKNAANKWIAVEGADGYRLPTEAEWEYACRAGTTTSWWWGDDEKIHRSMEIFSSEIFEVKRRAPNPFGLYDLGGNVMEWTQDTFAPKYSSSKLQVDPIHTNFENRRVYRGGTFRSPPTAGRSARRGASATPNPGLGFRVARTIAASPAMSIDGPGGTAAAPLSGPSSAPRVAIVRPPLLKAPFTAEEAMRHENDWTAYLGIKAAAPNSVDAVMVLIPPGEFQMGSSDEQIAAALKTADELDADQGVKDRIQTAERPQHRVVITKPFFIGATEVTIGQFGQFVEAEKYVTEAERFGFSDSSEIVEDEKVTEAHRKRNWRAPGYVVTDDSPVSQVTWNDAAAYCRWLSAKEKAVYRLPTEAEWEYACRAGSTSQYSFGDDVARLEDYGWYSRSTPGKAHPVRTKSPNGFGLYDMHGNVQEWCGDYYDEKAYAKSSLNDPQGPATGYAYVLRGGHWSNSAPGCRSAHRYRNKPTDRIGTTGFRVVREVTLPGPTPSGAK